MQNKYILLAVAVAVIVGGVYFLQRERPSSTYEDAKSGGEQALQPTVTPTPNPSVTPTKTSGTTGKLSYGEAIKKYPYRIQFINCGGNPGTISLKRNLPLMLDNRDAKAHTIKVAGRTYAIKAYDYALAYISKEGTYNLTCDGGGSANVNIEK